MKIKKKSEKNLGVFETLEFETFRPVNQYERMEMEQQEPYCINGEVRVEKYRIRVEKLEESIDVIHARLRTLWGMSENIHDFEPLKNGAKRFGLELPYESFGVWREKR